MFRGAILTRARYRNIPQCARAGLWSAMGVGLRSEDGAATVAASRSLDGGGALTRIRRVRCPYVDAASCRICLHIRPTGSPKAYAAVAPGHAGTPARPEAASTWMRRRTVGDRWIITRGASSRVYVPSDPFP